MDTSVWCLGKTEAVSCKRVSAAVSLTSSMPLQKAVQAVPFRQTPTANPLESLRSRGLI